MQLFISLIWEGRSHLKESFPQPLTVDADKFLVWCFSQLSELKLFDDAVVDAIRNKYHRIKIDDQGNISTKPTDIMVLIWNSRSDLQDLFPYYEKKDALAYWRWWMSSGADDYNFSNK